MYATRSRRTKTDKRDARTLVEACRLGAYRAGASAVGRAAARAGRARGARGAWCGRGRGTSRSRKRLVRRDGLRVASSEAHLVAQADRGARAVRRARARSSRRCSRCSRRSMSRSRRPIARIAALAHGGSAWRCWRPRRASGRSRRARSWRRSTTSTRFRSAHQFEAFLGLVPGERSSGEKRRLGRITKAGNSRVRYLLVEAGWRILRSQDARDRGAARVGAARSPRVVASGSRSSRWRAGSPGILYAMWRDGAVRCDETSHAAAASDGVTTERRQDRERDRVTECGVASALQLMAAVESRELVGAVHSIAPPKCAEATRLTHEREQKAEQQLETRADN